MFPAKVLVAVDGSEEAERAAGEASRLCLVTRSELHVVHVAPLVSAWTPAALAWQAENSEYVGEIEELNLRQGHALLEEQLGKINGRGATIAGSYLKVGRVDACVTDLAEELGAGLIVVSHRGHGALKRTLMGSVSMSLLHHAHCPVLVTRSVEDEQRSGLPTGPVLVAYDGSTEAEHAMEVGAELARAFEVELHLASVVDMSEVLPYAPAYARLGWEEEIDKAEQRTREWLDETASRLETSSGVRPALHVRNGRPSDETIRLGEELGAGLILLGSRGRGGVKRALLGSASTSVAQHAAGPVLVFRPVDSEAADGGG